MEFHEEPSSDSLDSYNELLDTAAANRIQAALKKHEVPHLINLDGEHTDLFNRLLQDATSRQQVGDLYTKASREISLFCDIKLEMVVGAEEDKALRNKQKRNTIIDWALQCDSPPGFPMDSFPERHLGW